MKSTQLILIRFKIYITISNLIKVLTSYDVCNGISDVAAAVSFIEHSVPKIFTFSSPESISSPLFQSKVYRHPSCTMFLAVMVIPNVPIVTKQKPKKLKV